MNTLIQAHNDKMNRLVNVSSMRRVSWYTQPHGRISFGLGLRQIRGASGNPGIEGSDGCEQCCTTDHRTERQWTKGHARYSYTRYCAALDLTSNFVLQPCHAIPARFTQSHWMLLVVTRVIVARCDSTSECPLFRSTCRRAAAVNEAEPSSGGGR